MLRENKLFKTLLAKVVNSDLLFSVTEHFFFINFSDIFYSVPGSYPFLKWRITNTRNSSFQLVLCFIRVPEEVKEPEAFIYLDTLQKY